VNDERREPEAIGFLEARFCGTGRAQRATQGLARQRFGGRTTKHHDFLIRRMNMPNPKQNEDGTLDAGVDADDTGEERQPQRVNQADESVEEERADDPTVDPDDDDEEDDEDLDEGDLDDQPGVQRG
jgi:hypothetical protein